MSGRTVLVTGCSGFVGSWLCAALADDGDRVVGLDRRIDEKAPFVTGGVAGRMAVVEGSVEDGALVEEVLRRHRVDLVVHLAARALVAGARADPAGAFAANVAGTWTVLEACRRAGTGGVLVASSQKVYARWGESPFHEDMPLGARSPYDVTKVCADLVAGCFGESLDLPVVRVRCPNVYGGGDLNVSRLVPGTVMAVLAGERPVIRSDGRPVRDYVHVADVVAAYRALGAAIDTPGVAGRAFNLASGEPVSVLELTRLVLAAAGRGDLEPVVLGEESEATAEFCDASAIAAAVGWAPAAPLERRLAETVAWYRDWLDGRPVAVGRG